MRQSRWVISAAFLGTAFLASPTTPAATVSFAYTGSSQSFTVPGGVNSLHVSLWGAGGAGGELASTAAPGGAGAYVTGDLAVTPGETLTIIVGGGGQAADSGAGAAGGFGGGGNGGSAGSGQIPFIPGGSGGGGYSGIFSSTTLTGANALVIAGGGGGSSQAGGQGALPTLTAGDGSNLVGGNGGDGGAGGLAGGPGGGGAGGGYNGGAAGTTGAPGGFDGDAGTDGGPAGSLLANLTNTSNSAAPTDFNPVGTSDPNYVPSTGGGSTTPTTAEPGEVVITFVPEPASLSLLILPFALATRRRRYSS